MKQDNVAYVLAFLNKDNTKHIFLAYNACIKDICYEDIPYIPGTLKLEYAKLYDSQEAAKEELYLLRYAHREFLTVKSAIIQVDMNKLMQSIFNIDISDSTYKYQLDESIESNDLTN